MYIHIYIYVNTHICKRDVLRFVVARIPMHLACETRFTNRDALRDTHTHIYARHICRMSHFKCTRRIRLTGINCNVVIISLKKMSCWIRNVCFKMDKRIFCSVNKKSQNTHLSCVASHLTTLRCYHRLNHRHRCRCRSPISRVASPERYDSASAANR